MLAVKYGGSTTKAVVKVASAVSEKTTKRIGKIFGQTDEVLSSADDVAKQADEVVEGVAKSGVSYTDVLSSASSAYKGSTVLGHGLSKHAGRHPEIWGKLTGNPSTWHAQALKHFDDIMNGPGDFIKITTDQGVNFLEKRLIDGRGIRLNMDGTFKGFID